MPQNVAQKLLSNHLLEGQLMPGNEIKEKPVLIAQSLSSLGIIYLARLVLKLL